MPLMGTGRRLPSAPGTLPDIGPIPGKRTSRPCAPAVAPGPRVAVPSGLSLRYRGPDHDRGNSAAYYVLYFHENRNQSRSRRALRAGAAVGPRTALTVTTRR
jgi:hypothetical protein